MKCFCEQCAIWRDKINAKINEIENESVYQGKSWDGVRKHFIQKIEDLKK